MSAPATMPQAWRTSRSTSSGRSSPHTTLLSLPAECIRHIADYLVVTEVPECLFEREQAWRTATVYLGSSAGSAETLGTEDGARAGKVVLDDGSARLSTALADSSRPFSASASAQRPSTATSSLAGSSGSSSRSTSQPSSTSGSLRPPAKRPRIQPTQSTTSSPATGSQDSLPGLVGSVQRVRFADEQRSASTHALSFLGSGPEDAVTKRTNRRLAAVCRDLAAKLRPVLLSTTRISSQEQLEWFLGPGQGAVPLIRALHLAPTSHILSVDGQTRLLRLIAPGQLRSLHLDMQPFIVAHNAVAGYQPSGDPLGTVVARIAELELSALSLRTNTLGMSPALGVIKRLTELTLEDTGVLDGGDPSAYQCFVDDQHRVLAQALRASASTLQSLVLRRRVNVRAQDYGYFNFAAVLCAPPIRFPRLRKLELRRCAVEDTRLHDFLRAHPGVQALNFYPETTIELPTLPRGLKQLFTNCRMPSLTDAVPPQLKRLCVSEDGPVLPPPTQLFVPRLPSSIETFHARLPPGVTEEQIQRLLAPMDRLQDVELLVKPLEWAECECPEVADAAGAGVSYEAAWQGHLFRMGAMRPSWDGVNMSAISRILMRHEGVVSLTLNHDHMLKSAPFPDIHHNGRSALATLIPAWWQQNQTTLESLVFRLFESAPALRVIRWRVCERRREAWAIWERSGLGLDVAAALLVEQEA